MNDEQYLDHCRTLLADFARTFLSRIGDLPGDHPLRDLADAWLSLTEPGADLYTRGPGLVARLFDTFPEFAPTFPRELLWFLGGQCLHYLADEEIAQFQALDDLRYAAAQRGEVFDLAEARTRQPTLH